VPTLYTALSVGKDALDPSVYGNSTNTFVLRKGQIIEVVVNNYDTGGHPFHLHGTQFQCLHRGDDLPFNGDESGFPAVPMRRDTFKVNAQASIVFRFKADNPGVFLFHCHIGKHKPFSSSIVANFLSEWHVESGLSVTFVSEPFELQNSYQIPKDHLAACKVQGLPTQGNCAGNTKDPLNTKDCISTLDPDPVGAYVAPSQKRIKKA
jgi:iron transport multicopper oxidase